MPPSPQEIFILPVIPGIGMEGNISSRLFSVPFELAPMQHSSFSYSVCLTLPAFCTNGLQMLQRVLL